MMSRRPESACDVRIILFDAVGTLIHVRPSVAEVYRRVGLRYGSQLTAEQIGRRFRESLARHQNGGRTNEPRERQRWRTIVAEVLDDIPQAGDHPFEELWDAFRQPEQWSLYNDVAEVWEELRCRGRVLGIASNFDSRLRTICQGLPLLRDAENIFISSEIGFPKPHPQFFHGVQRALRAEPREILLVGDSVEYDVEGALSAGWQAYHLDRQLGSLKELLSRIR
jgi:putative hydrolase of the HAD superfamily